MIFPGVHKALIGMIHVGALPGTPASEKSVAELIHDAVAEAQLLAAAGFDALLLENMHDTPYLMRRAGPEIVAAMTAITAAVRAAVQVPLGVQILAGANHEALAVAYAAGAQFIRAEGYVFASVADEGLLFEADAGPLLRYRRSIGAQRVRVFCDVKKKHSSHALTQDVDLAETTRAAEFFRADGVIVTGTATGHPTDPTDVQRARAATHLPVLVGSGVTPDNLPQLLPWADAFIVGSWFKAGGHWASPPDRDRAEHLVRAFKDARGPARLG